MITFIILLIFSFFQKGHFWRTWAIATGVVTVYEMTLGMFIYCNIVGEPFEHYLAKIGTEPFWEALLAVIIRVSGIALGVFFSTWGYRKLTTLRWSASR